MVIQHLPKWRTRRLTRRMFVAPLLVLGVMWATASSATAAPVRPNGVEGFARLGDCTQPLEGDTCHFLSISAQRHFVQIELTTITVTDGRQVYDSDILCNVEHARVRVDTRAGTISYADTLTPDDCEFLMGEVPTSFTVDATWITDTAPLAAGSNSCSVTASVSTSPEPTDVIFCAVDA
jgi:hypothetical protein